MSEGPIPWTAADRYASRYDMEEDDYEMFISLIYRMDAEYLKHREKQQKNGK